MATIRASASLDDCGMSMLILCAHEESLPNILDTLAMLHWVLGALNGHDNDLLPALHIESYQCCVPARQGDSQAQPFTV